MEGSTNHSYINYLQHTVKIRLGIVLPLLYLLCFLFYLVSAQVFETKREKTAGKSLWFGTIHMVLPFKATRSAALIWHIYLFCSDMLIYTYILVQRNCTNRTERISSVVGEWVLLFVCLFVRDGIFHPKLKCKAERC